MSSYNSAFDNAMSNLQMTPEGLETPTYNELFEGLSSDFKSIYGLTDLPPNSQDTQMLSIFVQGVYDQIDAIYNTVNSFNTQTAVGVQLDNLCAFTGISRKPTTKTIFQAPLNISVTSSFTLGANYQVQDSEGNTFTLLSSSAGLTINPTVSVQTSTSTLFFPSNTSANSTIRATGEQTIKFTKSMASGSQTIRINVSTNNTTLSVPGTLQSASAITTVFINNTSQNLPRTITAGSTIRGSIIGTVGVLSAGGTLHYENVSTTNQTFSVTATLSVAPQLSSINQLTFNQAISPESVSFVAVNGGQIGVVNPLTIITNNSNISNIGNASSIVVGSEVESDSDLRARRDASVFLPQQSSAAGLQGALNQTTAVNQALVIENTTTANITYKIGVDNPLGDPNIPPALSSVVFKNNSITPVVDTGSYMSVTSVKTNSLTITTAYRTMSSSGTFAYQQSASGTLIFVKNGSVTTSQTLPYIATAGAQVRANANHVYKFITYSSTPYFSPPATVNSSALLTCATTVNNYRGLGCAVNGVEPVNVAGNNYGFVVSAVSTTNLVNTSQSTFSTPSAVFIPINLPIEQSLVVEVVVQPKENVSSNYVVNVEGIQNLLANQKISIGSPYYYNDVVDLIQNTYPELNVTNLKIINSNGVSISSTGSRINCYSPIHKIVVDSANVEVQVTSI